MTDALAAARDLLTLIPVKIRKAIYGVLGLVIIVDGIWNVIPDSVDSQVVASFGALGLLLALANASDAPTQPDPVPPAFDGEFA